VTPLRRVAGRTFSSLNEPNLRLYFTGLTISQVGSWVQLVSLPWLVLHLTHSGTMLGITYAIQFLPILLFGAWGGVIADRYDKRRLLLLTTTLLGLCALVLSVITLLDAVAIWSVIVLAFLLGTVAALDNPTRRSFVPELVPPEELTNAISLNNAVFTAARIVGPSIAGILIATVGIGWCFMVNAASFVAVIVVLVMMKTDEIRASVPLARAKGQLRAGIRYAWNEPLVRLAILMTFVIGTLTFNYQVVLPLLAKRTFDAGPGAYAVMFAATGVGSLIGALVSAHLARVSGRLMAVSAIAFGLTMGLAAVAPSLLIEYIVLVPMGVAAMVFFSMANAAVQERADAAIRGRVTALFSVAFLGSTPIGSPIVGQISQQFGARVGLAVGATAAAVTGVVGLIALHKWVRPQRPTAAIPVSLVEDLGAQTGPTAPSGRLAPGAV
jgi:MFS family permease